MKIFSILLMLLIPAAGQAQFDFTTNNGVLTIIGYTGSGGSVTIPASTNGYPVTSIGFEAFENTSVTSVTIPNSITNIGVFAFASCFELASVNIPNSVISIGASAFNTSTALLSVIIPDSVTNIGDNTFYSCASLTNAIIGNSVTSIGNYAFSGCSKLAIVIIPDSVISLGGDVFRQCYSLTSVIIPNGVTNIEPQAFFECTNLTKIVIGNSVTNIDVNSFYECFRLTNVIIPQSVTSIQNGAFAYCFSLASIYFQGNAPSLNLSVFNGVNPAVAVVYYLPGTTGWDTTFRGGLPTKLWNPTMQTMDGKFGVQNNQFGFYITGTTNIPIMVEANSDFTQPTWTPLLTATLTNGSIYFTDPAWINYPNRFYRISSP